ncbi:MAG: hypothetical protein WKF40_08060 [Thermoleophilaceae bacterium]
MGYLIGQLGGLLPIPGGIGGIDGGLIGTLIVYGTPAAGTAAAVLAYRVILFWLPLVAGGIAFAALRRDLPRGGELASCAPAISAQTQEASARGAMAYDHDLVNRIRELVAGESGVTETRMFGGLAFLVSGNMSVAASGKGA